MGFPPFLIGLSELHLLSGLSFHTEASSPSCEIGEISSAVSIGSMVLGRTPIISMLYNVYTVYINIIYNVAGHTEHAYYIHKRCVLSN